jgi:hypothetical protein
VRDSDARTAGRIELADAAEFGQEGRSWRGCAGLRFQTRRSCSKTARFVGAANEKGWLERSVLRTHSISPVDAVMPGHNGLRSPNRRGNRTHISSYSTTFFAHRFFLLWILFSFVWRWVFFERSAELDKKIPVSSKELRKRKKEFFDSLERH